MTPAEMAEEIHRLSRKIDDGISFLRKQSEALAEAEEAYRKAKAEAWVRCPSDDAGTRSGEREWTAGRKEAWVNADTAGLRRTRDLAEGMRQAALEAVRARRAQMSAWQTLINAHIAEANLVGTGPR